MKEQRIFFNAGFLALILFVVGFGLPLRAATHRVDDDGGQDFTSIQDAIDAATAGDIVYVYPGTYQEEVTMKDEVSVLGYSPHVTTIDGQQLYEHVVSFNGTVGATLAGFRIKNSMPSGGMGTWHHSGIYVENGPLMIRNNIIEDNHGGIAVLTGGNPQIINNTIVDNSNGIIFQDQYAIEAPAKNVVIIYNTDKVSAVIYKELFEANGIKTDIITVGQVTTTNLSNYRLIVATDDTGSFGNWGTPEAVAAIVNSRVYVLGVGVGGA